MGRFGLAVISLAGMCAIASANGRPAATSTINFEQGNPQHIVAGMTFGLLLSDDGGTTWHWMCEKTVGYGGLYDPDYAYSPTGAIFATTFNGLKVMRDGCSFKCATEPCNCSTTKTVSCTVDADCPVPDPMRPDVHELCAGEFVSQDELGPSAALHYAAADPNDAKIYTSTNDGMSFPTMAAPGMANDWWDSMIVAPSNPMRIYLTGYRLASGQPKAFLFFKSNDGGATFTAMSIDGIATTNSSTVDIVSVDAVNPDVVYAHVSFETSAGGDSIYKSTTGGGTAAQTGQWTKILSMNDPFGLVFLIRSNGDLVAATQTLGAVKSTVGAACTNTTTCAWQDLPSPPHINCLVNNPATLATTHEVWACTHNYDSPGVSGDGYGIMKTTDLVTWTPVLRYQDIAGPVDCPVGTVQHDQCVESYMAKPSVWCCLEAQLGITAPFDCTGARDCGIQPDSPIDAGNTMVKPPKGCCSTGGSGAGFMLLALGTGVMLWRRRKR